MLLLAGALTIGLAAAIGGITGFGNALIATPFMLMAGFDLPYVVFVNLLVGAITRLHAAYDSRRLIDWRRVGYLGGCSVPGALAGAAMLAALPQQQLQITAGVAVMLCAVAMALPFAGTEPSDPSAGGLAMTGLLGGFLGTTTSLSGPPPVLLLLRARLPAAQFIADLAAYFVIVNCAAILILAAGGQAVAAMLQPQLLLLVLAGIVGNVAGIVLGKHVPEGAFRRAVLVLVFVAGAMAVWSAVR
ncbi:sulfite exporter TauE/SafE family protein [Mycobacterium sp. PS03-16]|uniref:sulfite exporter TauE/SafE family protein n=1 Tax=Mycobacterium sp. PS03-16 TaxID=2559611 RepID=UPI0010737A28|nr:sulfite exporter TauE/SafE family protein [Mycobacterium sp. PS03-16]TFV55812.1 sulfite exporter TauE/SafE family protein [Mycobacterium sp. PS03-16]